MTLATRNNVLMIGIVLSVAVFGLSVYMLGLVAIHGFSPAADSFQNVQHWLIFQWKTTHRALVWTIVGIGVLSVSSSIGTIFLRRYFLKVSAPDVFFFTLFVLSLSLSGLKSVEVYFLYLNLPTFYGDVITRAIYFGQFFGSFCLLASSLYAAGVQYQKYATVLEVAGLVSFAVAYLVPVDSLGIYPNLLYPVGNESTIDTILLLTSILSILSYLTTISGGGTKFSIAVAVTLVVVGRGLLFYLSSPPAIIAGGLSLAGGIALYGIRNYELHLWM